MTQGTRVTDYVFLSGNGSPMATNVVLVHVFVVGVLVVVRFSFP